MAASLAPLTRLRASDLESPAVLKKTATAGLSLGVRSAPEPVQYRDDPISNWARDMWNQSNRRYYKFQLRHYSEMRIETEQG